MVTFLGHESADAASEDKHQNGRDCVVDGGYGVLHGERENSDDDKENNPTALSL